MFIAKNPVICVEILTEPAVAECGHVFCRPCLQRWLERNHTCPTDRTELPAQVPEVSQPIAAMLEAFFPDELAVRRNASEQARDQALAEVDAARAAEEKRERDAKVKRLQRHFQGGHQLDADSLAAILDMCEGNVDSAIAFLQLEGEAPQDLVTLEDLASANAGVPKDFFRNPAGMHPLPATDRTGLLHTITRCLLAGKQTRKKKKREKKKK